MDVNKYPACEPDRSPTAWDQGQGDLCSEPFQEVGRAGYCFPAEPRRRQQFDARQFDDGPGLLSVPCGLTLTSDRPLLLKTAPCGSTSGTREVRHDLATDQSLSIADVCDLTKLCRTLISGQIKSGKLVARKAGRRTLVLRSDFRAWLEGLPRIRPAIGQEGL